MNHAPMSERLEVVVGDITQLHVEAIVTAANEAMCGGGGVDGAIHRAAGPMLMGECRKIGHCPQGEARITSGYQLPAKFIIHTVGPVWDGGEYGEPDVLASCYRSTLTLASERSIRSIAFPCIATGVYGYPKEEAAKVAVTSTADWCATQQLPERIIFCCFDEENAAIYRQAMNDLQTAK